MQTLSLIQIINVRVGRHSVGSYLRCSKQAIARTRVQKNETHCWLPGLKVILMTSDLPPLQCCENKNVSFVKHFCFLDKNEMDLYLFYVFTTIDVVFLYILVWRFAAGNCAQCVL